MAKSFEYRVCHVQQDRVTFVNSIWQGERELDPDNPTASLNSCPMTWEYLQEAGAAGWELVAAVAQSHVEQQQAQVLFLKREKGYI